MISFGWGMMQDLPSARSVQSLLTGRGSGSNTGKEKKKKKTQKKKKKKLFCEEETYIVEFLLIATIIIFCIFPGHLHGWIFCLWTEWNAAQLDEESTQTSPQVSRT